MSTVEGFPIVIASLNLAGSLTSFLGSGFIIATYLILPRRRHFRHVLILNLATSDCFNALTQSISGLYIVIKKRSLTDGPWCTLNGFASQFTVQATDCAVLAITIMTVYNVTRFRLQSPINIWDRSQVALVTFAIWLLPLITSFIALVTHNYGPASGSWCWIVAKPQYLRYVLTHGWRFIFIFAEIGLYTYLHIFLRNHYRNLSRVIRASSSQSCTESNVKPQNKYDGSSEATLVTIRRDNRKEWFNVLAHRNMNEIDQRYRSIQRILLLNAYPLAYIILWIPGIANRLVELTGHESNVTQVMQASTQFIGFANALTYGWNESSASQLFGKKDLDNEHD